MSSFFNKFVLFSVSLLSFQSSFAAGIDLSAEKALVAEYARKWNSCSQNVSCYNSIKPKRNEIDIALRMSKSTLEDLNTLQSKLDVCTKNNCSKDTLANIAESYLQQPALIFGIIGFTAFYRDLFMLKYHTKGFGKLALGTMAVGFTVVTVYGAAKLVEELQQDRYTNKELAEMKTRIIQIKRELGENIAYLQSVDKDMGAIRNLDL
jgi:hypothetical protein